MVGFVVEFGRKVVHYMSVITCPYCGVSIPICPSTTLRRYFDAEFCDVTLSKAQKAMENKFQLIQHMCPECRKPIVTAIGYGCYENIQKHILPLSSAREYPTFIPAAIRDDYREARNIQTLSPKASAALARRCLQGMIRDFWEVTRDTLYEEIDSVKDRVSPGEWQSLHCIRSLGNIGAHMEKDVNLIIDIDEGEADAMLDLIELLLEDWYVRRNKQQELQASLMESVQTKTDLRKKN